MKSIILVLTLLTLTSIGTPHAQNGFLGVPKSKNYKILTLEEEYFPVPKKSISLTQTQKTVEKKVLSCYYSVPSMYDRPFPVYPEQIDPFLCTHIMVAFGHVDKNCSLVPGDGKDIEFYNRTVKLKLKNPDLKILISVGGAMPESDTSFDLMMATNVSRMRFIDNSISFMDAYGFDGLDMDWEFPVSKTTSGVDWNPNQKKQFSDFFQEFRNHVTLKSRKYLLTAAVGARKTTIDASYDIPSIAGTLDFINLMTYDFHYYSALTPFTGPNSPLYNISSEFGYLATMNAAWAARYWNQNGMPANKIVLGIPTYGRTYGLVDERYHGYYDLAMGVASVGSNGYVSYVEACTFLSQHGTTTIFDQESREPYAYNERNWITFPNEQSTKEKAEFVNKMGFLGITVYNINSDDAWKSCNGSTRSFPIIQMAKETLKL